MRSSQFEGSIVMIEDGRLPGCRGMAILAGRTFGAAMGIIGLVAAKAGGGRVVELGRC
jgi:hypothetical protein